MHCLSPQVDPDKAFAVSISHDETVVQGPVAYMQCALLYTSSSGERRIRCVFDTLGLLRFILNTGARISCRAKQCLPIVQAHSHP